MQTTAKTFDPCRVTYEGIRYQITHDGSVRSIAGTFTSFDGPWLLPSDPLARHVRHEAGRLRRNCNARERTTAMKDLGLKRGTGGAFGGWE